MSESRKIIGVARTGVAPDGSVVEIVLARGAGQTTTLAMTADVLDQVVARTTELAGVAEGRRLSNPENQSFAAIEALLVDCTTPPGASIVILLVRTGTGVQHFAVPQPLASALAVRLAECAEEAKANVSLQ